MKRDIKRKTIIAYFVHIFYPFFFLPPLSSGILVFIRGIMNHQSSVDPWGKEAHSCDTSAIPSARFTPDNFIPRFRDHLSRFSGSKRRKSRRHNRRPRVSPSPSPSPRPASGWRRERRRPLLGGSKRESPPSPATNWQTSLWRWNSNYKVGGENGARGREGVAVAEGRRTRWSQTLWCKIHQSNSTKQITGNFLGATSTHGVPSACIPRNLDQRDGHFPFHHPFLTNQTPLAPSPRPLFRNIAPFIPAFHTSALSVAPDEYRILAAWPVASVLLNPPLLPSYVSTNVHGPSGMGWGGVSMQQQAE